MLTQDDITYFEDLLTQQLDDLLDRAEQTVTAFRIGDDDTADPLDRASKECAQNSTVRIRDRESRLIKKIKLTLAKIKDGEFGICEECGEDIPLARLKARPVAAHCIQCKTKMESWEKALGI